MPWLSRRNSSEEPLNSSLATSPAMMSDATVTFIPGMMDASCGTSPMHHKSPPMRMILDDMKIMFENIRCLPEMVTSMWSAQFGSTMLMSGNDLCDCCLQMLLMVVEMCAITMCVPMIMCLPGMVCLPICAFVACLVAILAMPLNQDQVIRTGVLSGRNTDEFADEKWIYMNGSMTSSSQMKSQLQRLSAIFCRPLTGIHNSTYGMMFDMISNTVTSISMTSSSSKRLYTELREALMSQTTRKVMVIAHGTGATILSHTLDKLHSDLPMGLFSKLEIYTFGAAAKHISNPSLVYERPVDRYMRTEGYSGSPSKDTLPQGMRTEEMERVIPHIEHYTMRNDFLARNGIIHHTLNVLDNRFCGRTFVIHRPGFMFSQYLDTMFPQPNTKKRGLLNEIPEIDISTAEKREFTAQGITSPMKPLAAFKHSPNDKTAKIPAGATKSDRRTSWNVAGNDCVAQARMSARECEGKTVRQLSRLWRYSGGQKPAGDGVGVMNGIGVGLGVTMTPEGAERARNGKMERGAAHGVM